jgi:alginate O-acetyltransferase complex protein AlgI
MIFTTVPFFVFITTTFLLYSLLKKSEYRKILLLLASYFFYGWWDWRFCFLIFFSTVVDYNLGAAISRTRQTRRRRALLVCSIVANLGVLGFFKYTNFFLQSVNHLSGHPLFPLLPIVLPVGISFFTFQTMSYTIDIYHDKLKPSTQFRDFALFVSFFPQLVAGPIVRAATFLPQLDNLTNIERSNFSSGLDQFIRGFVKKVLFANTFAQCADQIFSAPGLYDSASVWLGVLAYTGQIYYDFSGYSDMAIGIGRVFGLHFSENFRHPYFSRSLVEFWRRWHISLSSWLRDYLYIPLGGNRGSLFFTCRNVFLTMLLGGLWHGASWNFVIWGAAHGLALVVHRLYQSRQTKFRIPAPAGWLLTFVFVMFTWVFFRAQDLPGALRVFEKILFLDTFGDHWLHYPSVLVLSLSVILHLFTWWRSEKQLRFAVERPLGKVLACCVLLLTLWFAPIDSSPFIYFQF